MKNLTKNIAVLLIIFALSSSSAFGAVQAIKITGSVALGLGGLSVTGNYGSDAAKTIAQYRYNKSVLLLDQALKETATSSLGVGMMAAGYWLITKHPIAKGIVISSTVIAAALHAKRLSLLPEIQAVHDQQNSIFMTKKRW